jgi:hypothetical protein
MKETENASTSNAIVRELKAAPEKDKKKTSWQEIILKN